MRGAPPSELRSGREFTRWASQIPRIVESALWGMVIVDTLTTCESRSI